MNNKTELFKNAASIMEANGMTVDDAVIKYMQPLLDGSMTYEEHQAYLKTMIKEVKGHE